MRISILLSLQSGLSVFIYIDAGSGSDCAWDSEQEHCRYPRFRRAKLFIAQLELVKGAVQMIRAGASGFPQGALPHAVLQVQPDLVCTTAKGT